MFDKKIIEKLVPKGQYRGSKKLFVGDYLGSPWVKFTNSIQGHIDAESKRVEALKKQISELTTQIEESKKKENKTNNENNVLRESIGTGVGDLYFRFGSIFD